MNSEVAAPAKPSIPSMSSIEFSSQFPQHSTHHNQHSSASYHPNSTALPSSMYRPSRMPFRPQGTSYGTSLANLSASSSSASTSPSADVALPLAPATNPGSVPGIGPLDGELAIQSIGDHYTGAHYTAQGSAVSAGVHSVLIRKLPLNTSEEQLRLMVVWSKDMIDAKVLPVEQSQDAGFRSAVIKFRSLSGARDAKMMLDGKPNISNDAQMSVEIISADDSPSPPQSFAQRHTLNANMSTGSSSTDSSAASSASTSRQPSRFNGQFHLNGIHTATHLPKPESDHRYQNIFSPQSQLGNELAPLPRVTGKSVINDAPDDDDDLLKDPLGFAENGVGAGGVHSASAALPRRATVPHIPIRRLNTLSLNTNPTPVTSPPPQYNYQGSSFPSSHPASAVSPLFASSGLYQMNQHFRNNNFPPVNPADQNPPCNTLYVGNLPLDTSEEELKAMFSKQRGYKRLCFRTKQNGPMCFVEFEDVSFATKALHELYGHPLHNSVKGGIRLSFSKNPLGVRSSPHVMVHHNAAAAVGMNGMNGMNGMAGMNTAAMGNGGDYTTANGPPPGLTVPPGLNPHHLGYSTPIGGSSGAAAYAASVSSYSSSTLGSVWNGTTSQGPIGPGSRGTPANASLSPVNRGAPSTGPMLPNNHGPSANSQASTYLPAYMLGR